jgi:hypothetical protein
MVAYSANAENDHWIATEFKRRDHWNTLSRGNGNRALIHTTRAFKPRYFKEPPAPDANVQQDPTPLLQPLGSQYK